ncbi:MAG: PaaI family thioesterase [Patescibacteria group bacterium]|nr:PaaI family thioesterase [Patescibacteria group bacterium]
MNEEMRRTREKLLSDFEGQPYGRLLRIKLDDLSEKSATCSMRLGLLHCVVDSDPQRTTIVQGGAIASLADFAGVYLARMYGGFSPRIAPLFDLHGLYYRPCVLGSDITLLAKSSLVSVEDKRIVTKVVIENERGEFKGKATLIFARKLHDT